jgi:hypothetical protein
MGGELISLALCSIFPALVLLPQSPQQDGNVGFVGKDDE